MMECWSDVKYKELPVLPNISLLQYSITPILSLRAQFVHGVYHGDDMIDRCFRQDAVAEIEDMAGTAAGAAEDFSHSVFDFLRRCEERDRVKVALDGDIVADCGPAFVEIDTPVEADDIAAGGAHLF